MERVYHIHDKCCGHATNTVQSIVNTALKYGYKELYFTEHCPLDNNSLIYRPSKEEIKEIRRQINELNKKYEGKLKIFFGYEAEYSIHNTKYFNDFTKDKLCDFLIFGNHYFGDMWTRPRLVMDYCCDDKDLDEYYQSTKLAIESGIFSLFAHPDIFLCSYKQWNKKTQWLTKQIINLCLKHHMPLGFNANGAMNKTDEYDYPSIYFWREVAKTNLKVLIEADAHHDSGLNKNWLLNVRELAIKYGLEKNLVDKIDIRWFIV